MLNFGYYNMDCIKGMAGFPDKHFDLAIVDPPYGIGYDTQAEKSGGQRSRNGMANKRNYHCSGWDVKPQKKYFDELMRVSKHQIIWGAITLLIICHRAGRLFVGISDLKGLQGLLQIVNTHGVLKN